MLKFLASALLLAAAAVPASEARQGSDPGFRQAGGVDVYLGVVPAEIIREHPAAHAEAQMHGPPELHPSEKHVMVAVLDSKTGNRINDAEVTVRVMGAGAAGEKKLEKMPIAGVVTYGNYLTLPDNGHHDVRVEIRLPGKAAIVTTFDYPLSPSAAGD